MPESLQRLIVENFKAFGDRQELRLAPITLLFGGNSAGKSSVLQALLLLRQSLGGFEPYYRSRTANLVIRGEFTDLGSYDSLIHAHDRSRVLSLGVTAAPRQEAQRRFRSENDTQPLAADVLFRYRAGRHSSTVGAPEVVIDTGRSRISCKPIEQVPEFRPTIANNARSIGAPEAQLLITDVNSTADLVEAVGIRGTDGLAEGLGSSRHSILGQGTRAILSQSAGVPTLLMGFIDASRTLWLARDTAGDQPLSRTTSPIQPRVRAALSEWLRLISTAFRSSVARIQYLGPMRSAPERLHILTGEPVSHVGTRGEHVIDLLSRRSHLLDQVNRWFALLEIPYIAEVTVVQDASVSSAIGEVHCLLLRDKRTGTEVAPTDVGFGIGQVLPVVVQSILNRRGTLLIEQPEIHLHPALQARLGELFAQLVTSNDSSQFILETHSEHLILRLQRLIRRRELRPEAVSVLHVGQDESGRASVRELHLSSDGDFVNPWPEGFFDERLAEVLGN